MASANTVIRPPLASVLKALTVAPGIGVAVERSVTVPVIVPVWVKSKLAVEVCPGTTDTGWDEPGWLAAVAVRVEFPAGTPARK